MQKNDTAAKTHQPAQPLERHVVLVAPEVHWNTGNVGRTCLGAGAVLHLVRPLGFSLDSRQVRRAGLDYWPRVDLAVWNDFDQFLAQMVPGFHEICLFSKRAARSYRRLPIQKRLFLVFGSETRGLPKEIRSRYPEAHYHIPIHRDIRSLNLSTAVAIALYESLREAASWHGW
ncbi:MAG: tRNA (cytidine(34)-2'-O)-methyltransferase [Desulfobacterales bacterium]|jgi:tRNA (cytidine/uridine-2'-O-)-methyltransferase